MKKVFLLSLIVVLLGALIVPAIVAPAPAAAWSGTVTCSADSLHFRVYAGVPTYLLGFIPLDDGQTLTLKHTNGNWWDGTVAGWTVSDDAGWLNENLLFGVISGSGSSDIVVRVNTDGLTAGTYAATITFKFTTCGTSTITVPVTVDVIEPAVLGPLGIGVDKELFKKFSNDPIIGTENEYSGMVINLLSNPDDMMDMQAIETDGCWDLSVKLGDKSGTLYPVTGGTLTINGEAKQIVGGGLGSMGMLMTLMPAGLIEIPADFEWGNNYALMAATSDGTVYLGILLADIGKLMDLLPSLLPMLSTAAPSGTDLEGASNIDGTNNGVENTDTSTDLLTIPLKPILKLLPTLMPVLSNLLSNQTVMAIITPLMGLLPPIMIIMPMNLMQQLFVG